MAHPIADPGPLPPELAVELAPLSDAVLERLDQAFAEAIDDDLDDVQWSKVYAGADPFEDGEAPLVAHLVPPEVRRWRISGTGEAEWAMRHVAAIDSELGDLTRQRDEWQERIGQWFEQRADRLQARRGFFAAHLQLYALERREEDPRAKTLTLPSGVVRTVEHKPAVAVADEAAVIGWADGLGEEVAVDVAPPVPRKVHVRPLRDHCTIVEVVDHARLMLATGELIDWWRNGYAMGEDGTMRAPLGQAFHVGAEAQDCPRVGDGWPSPEEAEDLVARVEVVESHLEVLGPDGKPVPGVRVEPGSVSAKVSPVL